MTPYGVIGWERVNSNGCLIGQEMTIVPDNNGHNRPDLTAL